MASSWPVRAGEKVFGTFTFPFTPGGVAVSLAAAFLLVHLAFLPPTPTGVDAVNFALGVREFDVADHRPHPPGYPVFIALGKASRAVIGRLPFASSSEARRLETYALAMWSALFGAAAVFSFRYLFRSIDEDDRRAIAAGALTVSCPLFWFNAMRPMSDVSGLAAASAAQALIVTAFRRGRASPADARTPLMLGAFVAGVAIGFRSQTGWLTLPVLSFVTIDHLRRAGGRVLPYATMAVFGGVLLWGVPLLVASGGPSDYMAALFAQAREDFSGVPMLATAPDPREAVNAFIRLTAYPWVNKYIAVAIAGLAVVGGVGMLLNARPAFGLLALCVGPYAIFHLVFQDTTIMRYALPTVPALAYLAVRGLDTLVPRRLAWLVVALTCACIYVATPPVVNYARAGSPTFRAIDDVRAELQRAEQRPVLAMHHAVRRVLRLEDLPPSTLQAPPKHEWLELVRYWRSGSDAPIWFLAEPERTDLALIDPNSRRLLKSYRLPLDRRFFMSGVRPSGVDWYEINSPSWIAAEGWALTHETAGIAAADSSGPDRAAIVAYVRRRPEAIVVVVGGRHLDSTRSAARFELSIDGQPFDSWVALPRPGFFLRMIRLPAGLLHQKRPDGSEKAGDLAWRDSNSAGANRYATLAIRNVAADGTAERARTSVDQFDAQSADRLVFGFAEGWYEQEYELSESRPWRWMGPIAALRIHHGGRDLMLRMTGAAPVDALQGAATVTVRAGDVVLARVQASKEFDLRVWVPANVLDGADGVLTLESDRSFVPDEIMHNHDHRRLALRVSDLRIEAARDGGRGPTKVSGR